MVALWPGAVVEDEAVAVRGKDEGNVKRGGVVKALLHAVADAVVVVLGLDQRDRDVRLVVENEVGLLRLAARHELAAHDDPALGEIDLLQNLHHLVPAGALDGRQDELRADIAFGESALVHEDQPPPAFDRLMSRLFHFPAGTRESGSSGFNRSNGNGMHMLGHRRGGRGQGRSFGRAVSSRSGSSCDSPQSLRIVLTE
jgi:hypothetical protein